VLLVIELSLGIAMRLSGVVGAALALWLTVVLTRSAGAAGSVVGLLLLVGWLVFFWFVIGEVITAYLPSHGTTHWERRQARRRLREYGQAVRRVLRR
jgi:hypothetical protein